MNVMNSEYLIIVHKDIGMNITFFLLYGSNGKINLCMFSKCLPFMKKKNLSTRKCVFIIQLSLRLCFDSEEPY